MKGFTRTEFLVVMIIIGVMVAISLANFRNSQILSRDNQRKVDIKQISIAMEAYFNDHGSYPPSFKGKIKACGCNSSPCEWEGVLMREFCDERNTVYLEVVPGDPIQSNVQSYCYYSEGNLFRLYAKLEDTNDPEGLPQESIKSCGKDYNFGLSSSGTKP